jgi:type II secretory pathway pseudopilin PulG
MKLKVLVAALVISGLGASAITVASTSKAARVRSADLQAQVRAMKKENQQAKAQQTAGISASDVGDADSFGRNAHWMGLMGSGVIELSDFPDDCDPANFQGGPDDHCVVLNPQPALTTFNFPDIGRMVIPAKSANSLFCHMQTPISATLLQNYSTPNMTARVVFNPVFTFENSTLNNPAILDPATGLPYNGKITFTLPGISHRQTLQPGENFFARDDETRVCINGMISKAQLKSAGLTDAQATDFFKHDTIVTMGINGSAQGAVFASIVNNVRWMGD